MDPVKYYVMFWSIKQQKWIRYKTVYTEQYAIEVSNWPELKGHDIQVIKVTTEVVYNRSHENGRLVSS